MTKVYVVTHGDFSDYKIEEVFSTKKFAEKFINDNVDTDGYNIEEYEVDSAENKMYIEYRVVVRPTESYVFSAYRVSKPNKHGDFRYGSNFWVVLERKRASKELALKIAQDWYTQIVANHLEKKGWEVVTGYKG